MVFSLDKRVTTYTIGPIAYGHYLYGNNFRLQYDICLIISQNENLCCKRLFNYWRYIWGIIKKLLGRLWIRSNS